MTKKFKETIQAKAAEWNSTEIVGWRRKVAFVISAIFLLLTIICYFIVGYELKSEGHEAVWKFIPLAVATIIPQFFVCWYVFRSNAVPAYVRGAVQLCVFTSCWWLLFTVIIYANVANT